MPNWNYTDIVVVGSKENLDNLEKTKFDFQKIRPMPKEISDDANGKNLGGRMWKKGERSHEKNWLKNCKTEEEKTEMRKKFAEYMKDYAKVMGWIKKYGVNGWYEWANKYWGTKWNPYPNMVTLNRISDNELSVNMQTAWGLPVEILKFIAEKYHVEFDGSTRNEIDMEIMRIKLDPDICECCGGDLH